MNIEPGQRWTFVNANGERIEYVVVDPRDENQMDPVVRRRLWANWEDMSAPASIVFLLNERTGKYAMVTTRWLRGLPYPDGRSHWLPSVVEAAS
jgi:hypothetical protein